jgi:hypothetical protein
MYGLDTGDDDLFSSYFLPSTTSTELKFYLFFLTQAAQIAIDQFLVSRNFRGERIVHVLYNFFQVRSLTFD